MTYLENISESTHEDRQLFFHEKPDDTAVREDINTEDMTEFMLLFHSSLQVDEI
jgi:hypothetical protein